MHLPIPQHDAASPNRRILAEMETSSSKQLPGIRASGSRWSWWGRSVKYIADDGGTYYLNKHSALKFLKRHHVATKKLSHKQIVQEIKLIANRIACSDVQKEEIKNVLPSEQLEQFRELLTHYKKDSPVEVNGLVAHYDAAANAITVQNADEYHAPSSKDKLTLCLCGDGSVDGIVTDDEQVADDIIDEMLCDRNSFFYTIADNLLSFIEQLFKHTSEYKLAVDEENSFFYIHHPIEAKLVRESLQFIPNYHLEKLIESFLKSIRSGEDFPSFNVEFIGEKGVDTGGLRTDYCDELFDSIIKTEAEGKIRLTKDDKGTFFPLSHEAYQDNSYTFPILTEEEAQIHKQIGQLCMICYRTDTHHSKYKIKLYTYHCEFSLPISSIVSLGHHFDDNLFKLTFAFTPDELAGDINDIGEQRRLELFQLMAEDSAAPEWQEYCQLALNDTPPADEKVAEIAAIYAVEPSWELCKEEIIEGLYKSFAAKLSAVHAIAQGVASLQEDDSKTIDPLAFAARVQGSLDRQYIADNIVVDTYARAEVKEKAGWLRRWILDPSRCSEDNLKDFLKYCIGSSSMAEGYKITLVAQSCFATYIPFPKAHTCTRELEVAPQPCQMGLFNNHTENEFIRTIEDVVLRHKQYSMI